MADEQTPPENPFENLGDGSGFPPPPGLEPEERLPQGGPNVAARPGKALMVMGVVGVVVLFLLYSIFGSGSKEAPPPKPITVAPATQAPPPLPIVEPPVIRAPIPITPPPALPEPVAVPQLKPKDDTAANAQLLARMRSNMMLQDGGGSGLGAALGGSSATPAPTDVNSQWAANLNQKVDRVEATRIGNLHRTIAQGRIIHATMESALNTDLPAPIRAIVSRDTYGEAGNIPLIPKGSRLIGSYNTAITSGQTRVFVVWTRVIRPDGIDVMINSPLVDGIGSAGVSGQIDTKFQQIFARSLMSSIMNIGVAIGSDALVGGETTTTTSTTGSQTSGDGATTATTNALNRLGSITDGFLQRFISVPPTILVDQGTVVNVFVNRDVVFPSDVGGARIIN